jgi:ESAT-6 family protein
MAGYQSGHAELKSAASTMTASKEDLMQQLSQLRASCEGIAGQWRGAAFTAFQNLMLRFDADGQKLNESLQQISDQVSMSADEYQRQEEEKSSGFSGISGALDG